MTKKEEEEGQEEQKEDQQSVAGLLIKYNKKIQQKVVTIHYDIKSFC